MAASADVMSRNVASRRVKADTSDGLAPIAILAPAGRDGPVAGRVLSQAGFSTIVCGDMEALCGVVADGVGVLLVAEEALTGSAREQLLATLEAQPSWSDVPVVVLTGEGELSRSLSPTLNAVATRA